MAISKRIMKLKEETDRLMEAGPPPPELRDRFLWKKEDLVILFDPAEWERKEEERKRQQSENSGASAKKKNK